MKTKSRKNSMYKVYGRLAMIFFEKKKEGERIGQTRFVFYFLFLVFFSSPQRLAMVDG